MCYTANCLRIKQTMEIKVFQSKPKRVLVSYRNEELISMNKKKKLRVGQKLFIHLFSISIVRFVLLVGFDKNLSKRLQ